MTSTRAARLTGGAYLALALTGLLGQLVVRPQLHATDGSATILANVVELSAVANFAVFLELAIVLSQALAAVGFFTLFHHERPVAAYAVATFGVANCLAILASSAVLFTATRVATTVALAPAGDATATVALLFALSDSFWAVGGVFFGLWLLPMGWFMVSTQRLPRLLGWTLIVGGIGYLGSALLGAAFPGLPSTVANVLIVPATLGELWTIVYLLRWGIRPAPSHEVLRQQHAV